MSSPGPALWVHRLSVDESGSPEGPVKLAEVEDHLFEVAKAVMVGPREQFEDQPKQAREFLRSELFDRGVLRQGWGAPGMNLTRSTDFLKNYVIAMWRYWQSIPLKVRDELREGSSGNYAALFSVLQPYYREAAGRLTILRRMVEMRHGDIAFLPNVPEHGTTFTVARIADREYHFEDRRRDGAKAIWEIDFGHRRGVRDVRMFRYGIAALDRGAFGAPYLHAIDAVTARKDELYAFIERQYREQR
jgi:hypothetical protein